MAKTISKSIVLILMFLTFVGCNSPGHGNHDVGMNNVYKDKIFGLSISKPASWEFITAEESRERISLNKLEDESIEKLVLLFGSRPIVSMIKSRRQIPLPSSQITVNPLYDDMSNSPTDILRRVSRMAPNAFKNYSIINPPSEIEIDGHKAAYMKAHYTAQFWDENEKYPICYETWIILRQGYFFMISAVSSQSEDNKTRSEIASIIKSIKLQ